MIKAAIFGFGVVGRGIYSIVQQRGEKLTIQREDGAYKLTISRVLVRDAKREDRVLPDHFDRQLLTESVDEALSDGVTVVFEAMVGEEPAFSYLCRAIEDYSCEAVITANKAMLAKHGEALRRCAEKAAARGCSACPHPRHRRCCSIGFEATVGGGVPIIKTLQNMRRVQGIRKVEGVLNGTTNFILTEMRGSTAADAFATAVRSAQELGYAEADPSGDTSGRDAFYKLMVLSQLVYGCQPDWKKVSVIGVDDISMDMMAAAARNGLRYRHVASLSLLGEVDVASNDITAGSSGIASPQSRLQCYVRPQLVGVDHPLYHVDGATNAVAIWTDYLGVVSISGPGAGMYPTASVMVEDYMTLMSGLPAAERIDA